MSAPDLGRRALTLGAGAFAAVGVTAGVAAGLAPLPALSPVMEMGARIAALSKLPEGDDEAAEESSRLYDRIIDTPPQTMADAAILLMAAAVESAADDFYDDGTYGHERAEIVVRRVMHFIAAQAALDLDDYGAAHLMPPHHQEALVGTVAEATRRFNKVDDAEAAERRDRYEAATERQIIRARHRDRSHEDRRRDSEMVARAAARWNSMPKEMVQGGQLSLGGAA